MPTRHLLPVLLLVAPLSAGGAPAPAAPEAEAPIAAPAPIVASEPAAAPARPVIVQVLGDLNLAGSAEPVVASKGYAWPFEGTRALLAEGDLNIANLEAPVTERRSPFAKRFTYRMPPRALDAIKEAGFGLLTLANNHTGDQGPAGLLDTLAALEARGLAHAGAGRDLDGARMPALVDVRGTRVGVLAYSLTFPDEFWATPKRPGTAYGHEHWVREDVAKLRPLADVVLVIFHWGAEKRTTPKDYQFLLARASVEAGADAVLGHHPHVLQGIQLVGGRPVVFSLGNYAFGSTAPIGDSALARLTVRDRRLEALELIPLWVLNRDTEYSPRVAEGAVRERILATLAELSAALGTRTEARDGRLHVPLAPPEVMPASAAPPTPAAPTPPETRLPPAE